MESQHSEEFETLIRVGKLSFALAEVARSQRGKREIRTPLYRCPMCSAGSRAIKESSIAKHLEAHDRRAEKSRSLREAKELGMTAPIAGQLGFAELGVPAVLPRPEKAKP